MAGRAPAPRPATLRRMRPRWFDGGRSCLPELGSVGRRLPGAVCPSAKLARPPPGPADGCISRLPERHYLGLAGAGPGPVQARRSPAGRVGGWRRRAARRVSRALRSDRTTSLVPGTWPLMDGGHSARSGAAPPAAASPLSPSPQLASSRDGRGEQLSAPLTATQESHS